MFLGNVVFTRGAAGHLPDKPLIAFYDTHRRKGGDGILLMVMVTMIPTLKSENSTVSDVPIIYININVWRSLINLVVSKKITVGTHYKEDLSRPRFLMGPVGSLLFSSRLLDLFLVSLDFNQSSLSRQSDFLFFFIVFFF